MQKRIAAGLCACLMCALAGCGNQSESGAETAPGQAGASTLPPQAQEAATQASEKARADAAARSQAAGSPTGSAR